MAMFILYGDTETHEIVDVIEYDHKSHPDRYFEIYGFEEDNDVLFEETWSAIPKAGGKGRLIKVFFSDPSQAESARSEAEKTYRLVTLTRLRVPEWFYKEYYA